MRLDMSWWLKRTNREGSLDYSGLAPGTKECWRMIREDAKSAGESTSWKIDVLK